MNTWVHKICNVPPGTTTTYATEKYIIYGSTFSICVYATDDAEHLIARFPPTDDGWRDACRMVQASEDLAWVCKTLGLPEGAPFSGLYSKIHDILRQARMYKQMLDALAKRNANEAAFFCGGGRDA